METERLIFRERTKQVQKELLNLPIKEQVKFLGLESVEQLHAELIRSNKRLNNLEMKWLKWELIEKDSQKIIGSCGFHNWYEEHERAEVGYFLNVNFQGRGFMSEALKCVINYGFKIMKLNRIEAFISPSNLPSIKIIENLGFTREGILKEHYKMKNEILDSVVYSLLKSKWKPLPNGLG
ncbi:GNAT family N-acetyltransferase [Rufibacter glacialis]|uniref:GNAT family N-acetyltransferase n=1 Tax=Rufibacter glacialis TaxID=1259555 RepID=A0A5M8Q6V5_9BACT|nr:GNAT family protein [Rufibacter glacialis]KAA6431639.1 GNAT family N-acetyltransferase [Rufibacter glacialis]GGK82765.1 N-acetyltransferase [Rufibacter glacialis]